MEQCPQRYIGPAMIDDINVVTQCRDGTLPVAGGLLDQSAYYLALSSALEREQNLIESEKSKRS